MGNSFGKAGLGEQPTAPRTGRHVPGLLAAAMVALLPAMAPSQETVNMAMTKSSFGALPDGTAVDLIRLRNQRGMEIAVMNLGGTIVELHVPDRNGQRADVVLGLQTPAAYLAKSPYFGCVVGRYANRIARGRFPLDGTEYRLPINNAPNHLHGGIKGFDKFVWKAVNFADDQGMGVKFTLVSPDGDQGYPGALTATMIYRVLLHENELQIEYHAVTDRATVVNLSHHSYFNLDGHDQGTILDHELTIWADQFTPVDGGLIPTGELRSVEDTAFDFRAPHRIGDRIDSDDEQLRRGRGYDHNWVLQSAGGSLARAARLESAKTGRVMEVWTTEPGIQFYSGNFLDGTLSGKGATKYAQRAGLCLETQHFPDSPNQPSFPSTTLRPGEEYHSRTIYRFVSP